MVHACTSNTMKLLCFLLLGVIGIFCHAAATEEKTLPQLSPEEQVTNEDEANPTHMSHEDRHEDQKASKKLWKLLYDSLVAKKHHHHHHMHSTEESKPSKENHEHGSREGHEQKLGLKKKFKGKSEKTDTPFLDKLIVLTLKTLSSQKYLSSREVKQLIDKVGSIKTTQATKISQTSTNKYRSTTGGLTLATSDAYPTTQDAKTTPSSSKPSPGPSPTPETVPTTQLPNLRTPSALKVSPGNLAQIWSQVIEDQKDCGTPDTISFEMPGLNKGNMGHGRLRNPFRVIQKYVMKGTSSKPGTWPWMVQLHVIKNMTRQTSDFQFIYGRCAGVLLSRNWVLTAGHCAFLTQLTKKITGTFHKAGAIIGEHASMNISSNKKVQFEEIHVHPRYQPESFFNDIALIKLAEPVTFSKFVRPLCLPPPDQTLDGNEECTVAGWGLTSVEPPTSPAELQSAPVPLFDQEECAEIYKNLFAKNLVTSSQLCAGDGAGGPDACPQDSGGPLMCRSASGRYFSAGIVSYGPVDEAGKATCGVEGVPGVYARTSSFLGWIVNIVKD